MSQSNSLFPSHDHRATLRMLANALVLEYEFSDAEKLARESHGDQFNEELDWDITSDYQTCMASALRYAEMKPRGRYLKPHPDKRHQWASLLRSYSMRPKIGIAWTGGTPRSHGWRSRNLNLSDLLPILKLPFTFVSLEYKDKRIETEAFEERHNVRILDFTWATQTDDYDDTAALVDCLDAIVVVPTSAYHLAGGLGVPAHVIVHEHPHWHESTEGDCPWWESVKFYRTDRDWETIH